MHQERSWNANKGLLKKCCDQDIHLTPVFFSRSEGTSRRLKYECVTAGDEKIFSEPERSLTGVYLTWRVTNITLIAVNDAEDRMIPNPKTW